MNKEEFTLFLVSNGIDPDRVSFDDNFKDGYGIRKVYFRWELFLRERGVEFFCKGFPSEEEVLSALLDEIAVQRTVQNHCRTGGGSLSCD